MIPPVIPNPLPVLAGDKRTGPYKDRPHVSVAPLITEVQRTFPDDGSPSSRVRPTMKHVRAASWEVGQGPGEVVFLWDSHGSLGSFEIRCYAIGADVRSFAARLRRIIGPQWNHSWSGNTWIRPSTRASLFRGTCYMGDRGDWRMLDFSLTFDIGVVCPVLDPHLGRATHLLVSGRKGLVKL